MPDGRSRLTGGRWWGLQVMGHLQARDQDITHERRGRHDGHGGGA